MALLSRDDIGAALRGLPGWRLEGDAIVKEFTFAGFPEAVAFVSRLVPGSEAADHHPDLAISYRRVTVAFTTHSEGGVTAKDLAGARRAESCA
jgi:4a-hydroxytetrahydrobiopterin dehydratase